MPFPVLFMDIITKLIYFGLAIIPFVLVDGLNTRDVKFYIALSFAFFISLFTILNKTISFKKPWTIALLMILPLSMVFCPKLNINVIDSQLLGSYIWQGAFFILVFFMFARSKRSSVCFPGSLGGVLEEHLIQSEKSFPW